MERGGRGRAEQLPAGPIVTPRAQCTKAKDRTTADYKYGNGNGN